MSSNSNGRGLVSRAGNVSAHGRASRRPTPICCNRCRKPLATTLYVVACDCVFCEDCTFAHFQSNTSCPSCNKELGQNDFIELVIADPSPASQESTKNAFQSLFTKTSSSAKLLSQQEMCSKLMRCVDDSRRLTRFLMKQFIVDNSTQASRSGDIGRAYEKLQEEVTQLKQATNSQRIQAEQTISDLQNRLQALSCTVQEKENQIIKKNTQIAQYREIVMADGIARHPSSPHSNSSGGKRGPSNTAAVVSGGYRHQQRSRQQTIRPVSSGDSVITPIQATTGGSALYHDRPRSADSNLTFEQSNTGTNSRHIRDFNAPRSYSFSRGMSNGNGFVGMKQSQLDAFGSKRSRAAEALPMSPSAAFMYNNSSGNGNGGPFNNRFGRR